MERKFADLKYWKPIAFAVCCAGVVGFYIAVRDTDKSATPLETSLSDREGNSTASEPANSPDSFAFRVQNSVRRFETDGGAESTSRPFSTDDQAVDGQYDLLGLSAEEVKLLHARQQHEVEQMLGDLDAIVIGSENGDGKGITVRELRILQEQQEREFESAYDGEVVIPAGRDGTAALTVADLKTIHKEQEKELETTDSPDDIVIARSVNGTVDLTRAEIAALHERERLTLESDTGPTYDYPTPVPEGGSSYLTVEELRELHKSQSQD